MDIISTAIFTIKAIISEITAILLKKTVSLYFFWKDIYIYTILRVDRMNNLQFELKRQLFHLMCGIVIIILIYFNIINFFVVLLLLIIGVIISLLSKKYKIPIIYYFLENFDRKKKALPGAGVLAYFAGVILSLLAFEKNIALASIAILAFGDSATTIFGKLLGRTKNPLNKNKTVEGSIFGILFGFLGAVFFVSAVEAIIASVFAMLIEALDVKVDDNISVPLASGIILTVMRAIF